MFSHIVSGKGALAAGPSSKYLACGKELVFFILKGDMRRTPLDPTPAPLPPDGDGDRISPDAQIQSNIRGVGLGGR